MRYIKPKTPSLRDIVILYDDREKQPWKFQIFPMKRKRLKTGDYTIEGFEDLIAIEKKSGILELLTNLSGQDRIRFEKTLLRLSKFPFKALVVEDDFTSAPQALKILQRKSGRIVKVNMTSLNCWLAKITMQYGIPVLFIGPPDMRKDDMVLVWLFKIAHEYALNYTGRRKKL